MERHTSGAQGHALTAEGEESCKRCWGSLTFGGLSSENFKSMIKSLGGLLFFSLLPWPSLHIPCSEERLTLLNSHHGNSLPPPSNPFGPSFLCNQPLNNPTSIPQHCNPSHNPFQLNSYPLPWNPSLHYRNNQRPQAKTLHPYRHFNHVNASNPLWRAKQCCNWIIRWF